MSSHRHCRGLLPQLALMLAAVALLAAPASAIEFDMVFQTKCVFQEVEFDTSVRGFFSSFFKDDDHHMIPLTIKIEDPNGDSVFEDHDTNEAHFDIPQTIEGEYKICFTAKDYHTAQSTRIRLRWREGVEATDWEAVAKRDNLDAIHTEMLRLEDAVHNIHVDLQHIRRKEEQMRNVNEQTNARVAWFSIGALATCVSMAGVQLWNLRRFFIRKKLL